MSNCSTSIRLPRYFASGMVLQQNCPAVLQGCAKGAKFIYLDLERVPRQDRQIQGRKYGTIFRTRAEVARNGLFALKLPSVKGGSDYYRMTIHTDNQTIVLNKILFGEVWLMAGSLYHSEVEHVEDTKTRVNPYLRFFTQNRSGLSSEETSYKSVSQTHISGGHWVGPSKIQLEVSAIARSFADTLQRKLHCPVAVYDLAVESYLHSWLAPEILSNNRELQAVVRHRGFNQANADRPLRAPAIEGISTQAVAPIDYPSTLYRYKLAPFKNLGMRGILWLQNERDIHQPQFVSNSLRELTKSLRELFVSPGNNLQFIYNLLPPDLYREPGIDNSDLALVKYNEMLTMVKRKLCLNAGLITTYDLWQVAKGGAATLNLEEFGRRLQLVAQGLVYNGKIKSAPECVYAEKTANKLLLTFDNVGRQLCLTTGTNCLKGFMVRGKDGNYLPAEAKILYGVRVLVWNDEIVDPVACAYAYTTFNCHCNLAAEGLMPVVPFCLEANDQSLPYPAWLDCDSFLEWQIKRETEELARLPLWRVYQGKAKFSLDRHNKCHSTASLKLSYQKSAAPLIEFGPELDLPSNLSPLNLSYANYLTFNVFNSDDHLKSIALVLQDKAGARIQYANANIDNDLAWHEVSFDLKRAAEHGLKLNSIKYLALAIIDDHPRGSIYLDKITLQEHKV